MGRAAGEAGRENQFLGGSCLGECKYSHRKSKGQLQGKNESLEGSDSFITRTGVKCSGEEKNQQLPSVFRMCTDPKNKPIVEPSLHPSFPKFHSPAFKPVFNPRTWGILPALDAKALSTDVPGVGRMQPTQHSTGRAAPDWLCSLLEQGVIETQPLHTPTTQLQP